MSFMDDLTTFIRPIKNMVKSVVLKGNIISTQDRDIQLNEVETFPGDVKQNVENFQNYGLKGYPPPQSECILLNVGASTENPLIVGAQNRAVLDALPNLQQGDCVLYNSEGSLVHLKGGTVEIISSKIRIENEANELIAVLIELIDAVASVTTTVTTIVSPLSPPAPPAIGAGLGTGAISPAVVANLNLIKAKLESFQVT